MSFESDSDGWYPIHFAAYSGMPGTITALIQYGANIESLDKEIRTPLLLAAGSRSLEKIAELLSYGF